jgi:hypothetical protein
LSKGICNLFDLTSFDDLDGYSQGALQPLASRHAQLGQTVDRAAKPFAARSATVYAKAQNVLGSV